MDFTLKNCLSCLRKTALLIVAMTAVGFPATAENKAIADSLFTVLSHTTNPKDSLNIMMNLFDVLPRREATAYSWDIIDVATRNHEDNIALESIRNIANRTIKNDSILVKLYDMALQFPDTDARKETLTFITMRRNGYHSLYASPEERDKAFKEALEIATNRYPENLYDQIALLHYICRSIATFSHGDLLSSYLDQLGKLIEKLPEDAYSIRNAYYVSAAIAYAENDEYEKSINADNQLLYGIKGLEKHYHKIGRDFKDYSDSKYIIYNRLLSNFASLTPREVENYYKKALKYASISPSAKITYEHTRTPDIYYAMFHNDYGTALELLKSHIDASANVPRQRSLLKYLIKCAEETGDEQTAMEATKKYNSILEEYISGKSQEQLHELQVKYDLQDIKNRNIELERDKQLSEYRWQKNLTIVISVTLMLLLILTITLYIMYRRNRELALKRAETNKALMVESENLRKSRTELIRARDQAQKANALKTDFIKNMSREVKVPLQAINEYCKLIVDFADASNKKHLGHFANLVDLNSELLTTLINDVLRLSEIESSSMPIHRHVVKLNTLCSAAVDSMKHRVKPSVEIKFIPTNPEIDVYTDPQRVQQVLLNLLTNAAKFTDKGYISLAYSMDEATGSVVFTITDTGIGIKPENKEKIFERFVKLDEETQGAGLGLTISRLIAKMLGGNVELDTSYNNGAKFNFTLPKQ